MKNKKSKSETTSVRMPIERKELLDILVDKSGYSQSEFIYIMFWNGLATALCDVETNLSNLNFISKSVHKWINGINFDIMISRLLNENKFREVTK